MYQSGRVGMTAISLLMNTLFPWAIKGRGSLVRVRNVTTQKKSSG